MCCKNKKAPEFCSGALCLLKEDTGQNNKSNRFSVVNHGNAGGHRGTALHYLRLSACICGCCFSQREGDAYADDGDEQVFEQAAAFALDVAEDGGFQFGVACFCNTGILYLGVAAMAVTPGQTGLMSLAG